MQMHNGFLLPEGEGPDEGKKAWYSLLVPLTLSLSRKGRGNPKTTSSYKCKPLGLNGKRSLPYDDACPTKGAAFS